MSYDLHLVRTEDWLDAASDPIRKNEVDRLVEGDPELAWSADFVDTRDDRGRVTRYFMIAWRGESAFWWYRDQVLCEGPTNEQATKLVDMAERLGGHVLGDDGEKYTVRHSANGPELMAE